MVILQTGANHDKFECIDKKITLFEGFGTFENDIKSSILYWESYFAFLTKPQKVIL
jgi:hypothetical protein